MLYFGAGWIPWTISVLFNTIVQSEAGWSQHDFGHLSVFKDNKYNRFWHSFVMNIIKGASTSWWKHLHNQHHAKPNVINKDPDVRLDALFVLGDEIPKRVAKAQKKSMPYNWQHHYFFAIGPPLLFPIYFQYMIFKHPIVRKQWLDVFLMTLFYVKILILYGPILGLFGAIKYYFIVRCLESHWFVWVSQSNHVPMEILDDLDRPWLSLQLHATCDIEQSWFNDWFTGHLNFQIEHHLFPTMPRHNLHKIQPLARALCEKHGVPYKIKTLHGAFGDIVRSLKHSGEVWHAYHDAYNLS
jgi:fatty acid desaturase